MATIRAHGRSLVPAIVLATACLATPAARANLVLRGILPVGDIAELFLGLQAGLAVSVLEQASGTSAGAGVTALGVLGVGLRFTPEYGMRIQYRGGVDALFGDGGALVWDMAELNLAFSWRL